MAVYVVLCGVAVALLLSFFSHCCLCRWWLLRFVCRFSQVFNPLAFLALFVFFPSRVLQFCRQVHLAKMKGGGEVAVKVQRGGLKALFDQDLQVRGNKVIERLNMLV